MSRAPILRLALAGCFLISAAAACEAAFFLWRAAQMGRAIAVLRSGQDLPVAPDAPPVLQAARGAYLLTHGRVEEAQGIADRLASAQDTGPRADLLYDIGNFMLRRGLAFYFTHPMRETAPLLRIAQADYRAALHDDPDNWDARYNLDIVDALVRDDGEPSPTTGALMAPDKAMVPDEPGAPSGLP